MRVAIRADASTGLGTGHLRRCLSLARALAQCGAQSVFVSRSDAVAREVLAGQPFDVLWLEEGEGAVADDDAARCAALLASAPPDWVVVDHYRLDRRWHEAVRDELDCRVAVVDDLADRPLAPDLLVDTNDPDAAPRYAPVLVAPCKLLAGPRFALLDPSYADAARYRFQDPIRSIGIFMGGTDPQGHCVAALRACGQAAFAGPVEVVCAQSTPFHAALAAEAANRPGTRLVDSLPDLAGFFARHDLQLGAGGGATWERCCIGVPTIACVVAPNQMTTVPRLAALGALAWAREGQGVDAATAIARQLVQLAAAPDERRALGQAAARLVDGQGGARVAAVMACAAGVAPSMRPAMPADEALLLEWANDPVVRAQGFHPEPVPAADHARWFRARLADADGCRIAIAHAPNGMPVGQVRLERRNAWEIGYSVAAEFRGLGLGTTLLAQAVAALPPDGLAVLGRVKPANQASVGVFRRLGFHEARLDDANGDHLVFTRERRRGDNTD